MQLFFFLNKKLCDKLLMVDKGTIFSQKFHNKIYVTIFLKKIYVTNC